MPHDDGDNTDTYSADVAVIAADFRSAMESTIVSRRTAIRSLDALGRLVAWKSLGLSGDNFDDQFQHEVDLYEGMEIYDLLEDGWGRELYSTGDEPDSLDVALFNSLIAVLQATDRVMRGADLNKRSYEAFGWHAIHPIGRALIDSWIGRLNEYVALADDQRNDD
jgi:hypothetical protein